jgi:hypothetical protein
MQYDLKIRLITVLNLLASSTGHTGADVGLVPFLTLMILLFHFVPDFSPYTDGSARPSFLRSSGSSTFTDSSALRPVSSPVSYEPGLARVFRA